MQGSPATPVSDVPDVPDVLHRHEFRKSHAPECDLAQGSFGPVYKGECCKATNDSQQETSCISKERAFEILLQPRVAQEVAIKILCEEGYDKYRGTEQMFHCELAQV